MIGRDCFYDSAVEELTLPSALRKVHHSAFCDCDALRNIYVEDGCGANLSDTGIVGTVQVSPVPETMTGNTRVWDLRRLKSVVIPEGVERIGNCWFWGSEVESVELPASVREIGTDAFCDCQRLKCVTIAPGSRLEKIGAGSFYNAGIERAAIPNGVTEIPARAFKECKDLKEIVIEENSRLKTIEYNAFCGCHSLKSIDLPSKLETIGVYCFSYSGLESIVLPASVKNVGRCAFEGCE